MTQAEDRRKDEEADIAAGKIMRDAGARLAASDDLWEKCRIGDRRLKKRHSRKPSRKVPAMPFLREKAVQMDFKSERCATASVFCL